MSDKAYKEMCNKKWAETELNINLHELKPSGKMPVRKSLFGSKRFVDEDINYYRLTIDYDEEYDTRYVAIENDSLRVVSSSEVEKRGLANWEGISDEPLSVDNLRAQEFGSNKISYELAHSIIATSKVMAFQYIAECDRYEELVNAGVSRQIAEVITFMERFSTDPFFKMTPRQYMAVHINEYDAVELRDAEVTKNLEFVIWNNRFEEERQERAEKGSSMGTTSFFS